MRRMDEIFLGPEKIARDDFRIAGKAIAAVLSQKSFPFFSPDCRKPEPGLAREAMVHGMEIVVEIEQGHGDAGFDD